MADFRNIAGVPRGIGNNNPGNIIISPNPWQGKIPVSANTDGKFEQFSSIEMGIRALAKNLNSYYKRGLDTTAKMFAAYASSPGDNPQLYADITAKAIGVKATDKISLTGENVAKIIRAIIAVENGSKHTLVTNEMIIAGVNASNVFFCHK